jgi:hypothetical protein
MVERVCPGELMRREEEEKEKEKNNNGRVVDGWMDGQMDRK